MAETNGDVPQTNGNSAPSPSTQQTSAPTASQPSQSTTTPTMSNPAVPLTSLQDSGLSKRPRDARLIHMLLSSLGCTAYQERVPLQLLDFAYRHSSSILSDALHLSSDAYISQQQRARDPAPGSGFKDADGQVSVQAVQLAISSRLQYQFSGGTSGGGLSKEFMIGLAQDRNKVALPRVLQNEWGIRLPSERFVLTGVPWGLKGEWVEEDDDEDIPGVTGDSMEGVVNFSQQQQDGDDVEGEGGNMADIFGEQEDADVDME